MMIRDPDEYQRQAEKERLQDLRRMTIAESLTIGEALLTSEVMQLVEFSSDDNPLSLAIALGIKPSVPERRSELR